MKKSLTTLATAILWMLYLAVYAILATAVAKPVWMAIKWIWNL